MPHTNTYTVDLHDEEPMLRVIDDGGPFVGVELADGRATLIDRELRARIGVDVETITLTIDADGRFVVEDR